MTTDPDKPPRISFAVPEMLVVVAIISALWAFLLPAVNYARERPRDGIVQRALLPQLKPLYESTPGLFLIGTPVVVTACAAVLFGVLRCVLPKSIRKRFPWKAPPRPPVEPPEPIADSRPAVLTSLLAFAATAILLFVASHVRADRTNRRPVVTWEGPIADYVQYAAILGWILSAAAIILGSYTLYRFRSKVNVLASIGRAVGFLNYFGTVVFWAAVFED